MTLGTSGERSYCWTWHGYRDPSNGYGKLTIRVKVPGKKKKQPRGQQAHRVAFEVFTGKKLIRKLQAHHRCYNRLCINPDHLEALSNKANSKHARERQQQMASSSTGRAADS